MKILIVDDNILFRQGLAYVLHALEDDVTVIEAADFERAMAQVSENPDVDLVLLDLNMPGKDGFSALDTFCKTHPAMPVVIISVSKQQSDMHRAMDGGAMGYITKDSSSLEMQEALQLVLSGGIYVPPIMANPKNNELPTN